jgi:putative flippase GtrA
MIDRLKVVADAVILRDIFQVLRYFGAGLLVSLGYTITVVLMVEVFGWSNPSIANAVSFILWTPVSYFAHKMFTFRDSQNTAESAVKFFVIFLAKLATSVLVIEATTRFLSHHYFVGLLLNWVVIPLVTFVLLKFWVFDSKTKAG